MNIKTFDLNLLRVLDALLSERNVTRAAARLNLSQPAVSNALARLREQLGDPLLVRGSGGLLATARALELAEPIQQILRQVEESLSKRNFDPATLKQTFTVVMPDYVEFLLLPALVEQLAQEAPGVRLAVHSIGPTLAGEALANGSVDLALGYLGELPDSFFRQALLQEDFVCLARQGHPRIDGSLSLEQFLHEGHILLSPQGGGFWGVVDGLLQERGLRREVRLSIQHFLLAPQLVANGDLLITLARRVAQRFAGIYPLQILSPPLAIPGFAISQAWHGRVQQDPAQRWLRTRILDICRALDHTRATGPGEPASELAPAR